MEIQGRHMPRVTVAMSMHNAEPFLHQCIDSILSQTYDDFELLIVDDGSTDSSPEIVESYKNHKIRLIRNSHDFISSLNILLEESRGEYIARMDADDIMMPDRLEVEVSYLDSHPDVDAVCSGATRIDRFGNRIGHIGFNRHDATDITARMMCEVNHVCNPTTMMRRSSGERFNLRYSHDHMWAEDYDFWSSLLVAGGIIHCLPDILLLYRESPSQVTALHYSEMMEATGKIKNRLTDHLVTLSNPGYQDPLIAKSDKELTLIIPFLNEGEEVANTVRSFLDHGGRGRVEIIVINDCSYDSYPYAKELSAIPEVTYVLNRKRLGVAASRDKGVSLCRTPYFLLLDAHMRAYDDLWVSEIPQVLRQNDRQILCCQTRFLIYNDCGEVVDAEGVTTTYGARMIFKSKALMPGIEWVKEEREAARATEEIQCVLGAGYAASCSYWLEIGGLEGLDQYGCDEQLISLKAWMSGGRCLLLKNCVLGHIYRNRMPYIIGNNTMLRNSLFISESLFSLKERCKARAAAYLVDSDRFVKEFTSLSTNMRPLIDSNRRRMTAREFVEVVDMNRYVSSLDRQLKSDIAIRLDDIATRLMEASADNNGLFSGATAYGIWLSLYAKFTGDKDASRLAASMIQRASSEIVSADITFATGIAGIGWALRFLLQEELYDVEKSLLDQFDNLILEYIVNGSIDAATDLSLPTGTAGILAYCCIAGFYDRYPKSFTALDNAAASIISGGNNDFTGLFYAFLWMQLRSTPEGVRHLPTDWGCPTPFIPKNQRFWNISLYDGILASSISILQEKL